MNDPNVDHRLAARRLIKKWKANRKHRFRLEKRLAKLNDDHSRLEEIEGDLEASICKALLAAGDLVIDGKVYTTREVTELGETYHRLDVLTVPNDVSSVAFELAAGSVA